MESNVDEVREDPCVGLRLLTLAPRRPGMFMFLVALEVGELVVQLDAVCGDTPVLLDGQAGGRGETNSAAIEVNKVQLVPGDHLLDRFVGPENAGARPLEGYGETSSDCFVCYDHPRTE